MLFSLLFSFFIFAQEEEVLNSLEKPERVTEEGEYFYNTDSVKGAKEKNTKHGRAVELEDGTVIYDTKEYKKADKARDPKKTLGQPKQLDGEASIYEYEKSEQNHSASIQFFETRFDDFTSGNATFGNVYKTAKGFIYDHEWQLKTNFAKFGLIVGGGVISANGKGRFADGSTAREEFDLYLFPLVAKLRFNLEFMDSQYIVPYIEGGGGIIGLVERRDDGEKNEMAYTPVFTFGGGLAFLLDWMMGDAIARMDNTMGINHVWLVASLQVVVATDDEYDLSEEIIMGGFKVDF
jgi:hypothetical protein